MGMISPHTFPALRTHLRQKSRLPHPTLEKVRVLYAQEDWSPLGRPWTNPIPALDTPQIEQKVLVFSLTVVFNFRDNLADQVGDRAASTGSWGKFTLKMFFASILNWLS